MADTFERDLFFDPSGDLLNQFYSDPTETIRATKTHIERTKGMAGSLFKVAEMQHEREPGAYPEPLELAQRVAFVTCGELALQAAHMGSPGLREVEMSDLMKLFVIHPGTSELKTSDDVLETLKDSRDWAERNIPELDRFTQAIDIYYTTSRQELNLERTTDHAVGGFTFTAKHLLLNYNNLRRVNAEVASADWSLPVEQMPDFI